MDDYTAALRVLRTDDSPAWFAAGSIESLRGVKYATVDRVDGQVLVRFDRGHITVGDLVRWIEDQGMRVLSVSQQRAAAPGQVAASA